MILWLHGFPLTSQIFEKQRAIRGFDHLMPELPALESMDDYARFAVSQLDARGIEKATIAGLSMGGYICFAVWRLFPERVNGLILIDTRETADTDEARKGRYDSIAKVEQEGVAAVADAMLPKMVVAEELKPRVREIMMTTSPEYVKAALRAMATRPDSSSLLPSIDVPTLIIVGEEDKITPPSDAERMESAIPNARLVKIAGAGHLSNFEKPDEVNAAIGA
ncbi:MAG TPA: alpha/beta fold hydrolase [Thermoanaerobaculia bacterium]|nr:alpha/beta fold hydrolase [Thermoanaerobaculia bacterium]